MIGTASVDSKNPASNLFDTIHEISAQQERKSDVEEQQKTCGFFFTLCSKSEPSSAAMPVVLKEIHDYLSALRRVDSSLATKTTEIRGYCQSIMSQNALDAENMPLRLKTAITDFLEATAPQSQDVPQPTLLDVTAVIEDSKRTEVKAALVDVTGVLTRSPKQKIAGDTLLSIHSKLNGAVHILQNDAQYGNIDSETLDRLAGSLHTLLENITKRIGGLLKKNYTDPGQAKSKYKTFIAHPKKGDSTGYLQTYGLWGARHEIFKTLLHILPLLAVSEQSEISTIQEKFSRTIQSVIDEIKHLIEQTEPHLEKVRNRWSKFPKAEKHRTHRACALNLLVKAFAPKELLVDYNQFLETKPKFKEAFAADYKKLNKSMTSLTTSANAQSFLSVSTLGGESTNDGGLPTLSAAAQMG